MRSKTIASLFLFLFLILVSGCDSQQSENLAAYAPEEANRLVIYTSHQEDVYEPIIREFEARTGIWVQIETGGTLELLNRIEEDGENTSCDLIFGGGVETLEARKELFAAYQSPLCNEISSDYYSPTYHWTPFSSLPIVLIYNSKLVRMNPPSGWDDLLDSTWKGKIAFADPANSGSSYTALSTLLQLYAIQEMEQVLGTFTENLNHQLLSQSKEVVQEVANGNCYIGITLEDDALRGIQDGYDIAMVYPKDGTSAVCDGLAIIDGCAHPENAQKFIDFALSEEVQQYLVDSCSRRSVRADLATESDLELMSYDISWASQMQEYILSLWNRLIQEVTP